jgi:hypothetical protein
VKTPGFEPDLPACVLELSSLRVAGADLRHVVPLLMPYSPLSRVARSWEDTFVCNQRDPYRGASACTFTLCMGPQIRTETARIWRPAGYRYHNPKQKILFSEVNFPSVLCLAGIRNGTLSHFLSHEGYKLIQAALRSFLAQSQITLESFRLFSDRSRFRLAQSVSSNTGIERIY